MNSPQRLATNGLTCHVKQVGTGPPLLFLGGSNFDLSINAPIFNSELCKHYSVAAADPRGLGLTDAPEGFWLMKDYAQDALDLLDLLGWEKVNIMGESFGAMVALELSLLAPDRIERMVLAAGAPGGAGGSSYPIQELQQISDKRKRAIKTLSIQDVRFERILTDDPAGAEQLIVERMQKERHFLAHANNATGYPRLLATRATHYCWDRLSNINAQNLIIAGSFDQQAPLACSEAMAARIPSSSLIALPAGHTVSFGSSAAVHEILAHWGNQ